MDTRAGSNKTQSITASPGASLRTVTLLRRLALETDGQDLVEYALLTTFIGFAGAAAWAFMQTGLGTVYNSYVAAVWNMWNPPDPVGGGA
jgi:Flp pilus assembly pilin Flp